MKEIFLTGNDLTLEEMVSIARRGCKVSIKESALERVKKSRAIIDDIVKNEKAVYGVTTGFGEFCNVSISKEDCRMLQRNLICSHACGYGPRFSNDVVRAIMLLRANALSKGFSGIRPNTLQTLVEMINKGVYPIIPEKGSLGASGDLAPLAHMVLPMIGEGEAEYKGEILPGSIAMERAGITIIELDAKEGLALINGTQVLTATGALATYDAIKLLKTSDIAAALSMEALRGITDAFDPRIHVLRPHPGQLATARNILKLVEGSTYVTRQGEIRVQDAYSLRCIPQIHGASKDAINYVKAQVEMEINSVTDNPIVTEEGDVISGGNFHGEPMALSFDFLGIGSAEIASVSERRLERLINPQLNDLPAFLAKHGGLNSGFMITQYAAAALVSENKILAHPASVDSIPSSANQEDLVSMGTIAARKARDIVDNATRVVSTEILAACQAIDFRKGAGFKLGMATQEAYNLVRKSVDFIEYDIVMYKDLDRVTELVKSGKLLEAVEKIVEIEY
ncbi:histidine ammonia-lyase [Clostridium estertheticum]|uniref:histidine ammonia-lyase n=1 Tax=Clostridium estertheticum TaxID=238834 RepID=UPI001C0B0581|nr:histidine ammonia-lyase [Clostridium estertheticum]MBU3172551.1 histidine ammonia-lyase [Clostridium estertheticum]